LAIGPKCRVERVELTLAQLNEVGSGLFPGLLGIEVLDVSDGTVHARLDVREKHLAPNGYLHAGAVVSLADTACGYGSILSLPEGATGFTTIELKTNFLRTTLKGEITCEAKLAHGGRTTQLWDATVSDEDGRALALFRCTQLVLR
jgi:1,4-dihydroxy-2-naphthoyl-CoA hydrolase